jgi:hypothetical protein
VGREAATAAAGARIGRRALRLAAIVGDGRTPLNSGVVIAAAIA